MTQSSAAARRMVAFVLGCQLTGLLVASAQHGATVPVARVVFTEGRPRILKEKHSREIRIGDELLPEDMIVTAAEEMVVLELLDGSQFEVLGCARAVVRKPGYTWVAVFEQRIEGLKRHVQGTERRTVRSRITAPTAVISVRG